MSLKFPAEKKKEGRCEDYRDFCARSGGYNLTEGMYLVEISKEEDSSGGNCCLPPGLPYKLKERLTEDEEMEIRDRKAFWVFVRDCLVVGFGLGLWFLACWLLGWQYGR